MFLTEVSDKFQYSTYKIFKQAELDQWTRNKDWFDLKSEMLTANSLLYSLSPIIFILTSFCNYNLFHKQASPESCGTS